MKVRIRETQIKDKWAIDVWYWYWPFWTETHYSWTDKDTARRIAESLIRPNVEEVK